MLGSDGAFHRPHDLDTESLSPEYAEFGNGLHSFLGIREHVEPEPESLEEERAVAALSDENKKFLALGKAAAKAGLTQEEIEAKFQENEELKERLRRAELELAKKACTISSAGGSGSVQDSADSHPDPAVGAAVDAGSSEGGCGSRRGEAHGHDSERTMASNPLDGNGDSVHVREHTRSRPSRGTA